jgi:transcriptional regulator
MTRLSVHGGVTRILIIDDDPKASGPGPAALDGALAEPAASGWPADFPALPPSSAEATRPAVHEYQIATPLPGAVPAAHEIGADPGIEGQPDPSTVRELIARVEELLHRTRRLPSGGGPGWAGTIQFGSVLLEPATQTVLRAGQPVRVTHTEFRLLLALIRRRGAIASRMDLLREIWGAGAAVSRRAVDTHIARLRRKLEDDPANPRHILTALAWGYRFRP